MAGANVAHKISSRKRTQDVLMSENVDFAGLLLSEPVQRGLLASGFEKPSPIQLKAIPLGRCGLDLIVQAKSGTGKTCVFSVIALENIQITSSALQVLVLAPTREIAVQIQDVIKNIGACLPRLACHTFIGGLPIKEDIQKLRRCQIAIGSPGRVKHLIEHGLMSTDSIRIFVLDEADKLLEDSFQEQINWIYSTLPDNKQILALSATYPEYLAQHLTAYMRNPTFIRLNISDPALLGIKQYYSQVKHHPLPNKQLDIKTDSVITLLSNIIFKQCLIFSNLQTRAQNLCSDLQSKGWPTSCIAGSLDQKDRLAAMDQLKTYKCRVLISTDLTSRGIDADKVDLVINLDVPYDHETYLHRIGRAGRFGSFGAAVSIVSEGKEEQELWAVERKCHTKIHPLPDPIPNDLVKIEVDIDLEGVISVEQIVTRNSTTTESCNKSDKLSEVTSHDAESEPAVDKDNNQNEVFQDNPGQITEVKSDELKEMASNGHIVSEEKVSVAKSSCLDISSQNDLDKSDTCDNQRVNSFKNSHQDSVQNLKKTDTSPDLLLSNSSPNQEENLTANGSDVSDMYPSRQKYVFHDEHSSNMPANHQGNKMSKNSRISSNAKTQNQEYSKINGDISQDTENKLKLDSCDLKYNINVNQSNSADIKLTKVNSLDSPVVDVKDFLSTSVTFSKSKKSQNDKPYVEKIVSDNPPSYKPTMEKSDIINASNKPMINKAGITNASYIPVNGSVTDPCDTSPNTFAERRSKLINPPSNEGPASVTDPCDTSPNTFSERHSKLKAKLEKIEQESVVKDSKNNILKCCSDLVKSIQSLNIGQNSSQNEDLSTSSGTTEDVGPKIVENTDPGNDASKFTNGNSNSNNAKASLSSGVESNSGIVKTENPKNGSLSKTSSTKRKGRTYENILISFNEFQSSNTERKPCDYISRIKQDLQNAAKHSSVDENLKMALKNLDQSYSVNSKKSSTKSVSLQTEQVKSAESLLSIGTQTQIPCFNSTKLTNRMAVSSLAQFSTNHNSDNSVDARSRCQEDSEVLSATNFDQESKLPMCQVRNCEEKANDNQNQHGLYGRHEAVQNTQFKSTKSTILKDKGRQIQYDLKDMEQKIRTGELKFGTSSSFDLDDDLPQSKILVANQNGVASLSDVEQLSARSSSNSDLSSSEIESENSESTSDLSSVSRRKNKIKAVTREILSKTKSDRKTKGVRLNQNRDERMDSQNIYPEMSRSRNEKTQKHLTHGRHGSHNHLGRKSKKSHVFEEKLSGYDEISQAPAECEYANTQWYKQYYEPNEGHSYSGQGREVKDAYSEWYEQNQTKSRKHREKFDMGHANSDQYQQNYDQANNHKHQANFEAENAYSDRFQQNDSQTNSRKNQDFDAGHAYSNQYHQYYDQASSHKQQANLDAEHAYANWYHQWYDWYMNYYTHSNQNPYDYMSPSHYPYGYGAYDGMPFQAAPPKSVEKALKDSVRFAKIQKEYIKQMSK